MIKQMKTRLPRIVAMLLAVTMLAGMIPAALGAGTDNRYLQLFDRFKYELSTVNYDTSVPINNEISRSIYIPIMQPMKLEWRMEHTQCVKFSVFTHDLGAANGIGDFIGNALVYEEEAYEVYQDEMDQYESDLFAYEHGDLDEEPIEPEKPAYLPIPDNGEPDEHTVIYNGDTDLMVYWEGYIIDSDGNKRMVGEYVDGVYEPIKNEYVLAFDSHDYKDGVTGVPSRLPLLIEVDWTDETIERLYGGGQITADEYAKYKQAHLAIIGDPVDITNGSFLWEYTDFALYGAQELSFTRKYNSADSYSGMLGTGWRHNYGYHVVEGAYTSAFIMANGYRVSFSCRRDGSYVPPRGSDYAMDKTSSGFTVSHIDGTVWNFDLDGNLTRITGLNGDTTTLTYSSGKLATISNQTGTLSFSYTGDKLTGISDGLGRSVSYAYNASNELVSFTNPEGDTIKYGYADGLLSKITDFNNVNYITNIYNSDGRVVEQYLAGQGTSYFSYDFANRKNSVTDPQGNITYYYFDENRSITRIEDVTGQISYTYSNGRVTSLTDRLDNVTTYKYDAAGNRTETHYPDGTRETAEYNSLNLPIEVKAKDDTRTYYRYDIKGNLIHIKESNGNESEYEYDSNNNLILIKDAMGYKTAYEYDDKGNRTKVINSFETDLENENIFEYDTQGRLIKRIAADGGETEYVYSTAGKLIKTIDALGNETEYNVNGNGYDEGNTDALGNETVTRYNEMNKPVLVTDAEGNSTAYAYDSVGNLTCTTDAMGRSTFYTYDAKGRMVAMTEPASSVKGSVGLYRSWFYQYDAEGRMLSTTDPLGYTTSQEYDKMGRTKSSTNARGKTTSYQYDNMGRTTKVTNALGGKTESEYDAVGNLVKQTDARGNSWVYEYDALNRMKKAIDPMGTITEYVYDGLGRTTDVIRKVVSTELYRTKSVYDEMGRLIKRIDAEGNETAYEYDLLGRLVKTTDAENGVTVYSYDAVGKLLTVTAPDGGKTSYVYDKNGRTTKVTELIDWDSDGNEINKVTEYVYDKLGRTQVVKNILEDETVITRNAYDVAGNLVAVTVEDAMTDINGNIVDVTTGYAYDLLGRVVATTDPNLNVTRSEYDGNGNVMRAIAPDGGEITYSYDDLDRLTSYVDAEGYTFSFEYDANGNTVKTTDGRGKIKSTVYDKLNRPVEYKDELENVSTAVYDADGRVIERIGFDGAVTKYTYDNNGNVSSVTAVLNETTGFTTEFTYDKLNRVKTTKDARGAVTTYTYNTMGKVATITDALNGVKRYEYDLLGRLTKEYNELNQLTEYTYDALGRVLTVKNPLGKFDSFTYDKLGRIKTVTDKNGNTTTYTYDKNGNIVKTMDALNHPSSFEYDSMNRLIKVTLYRVDTNVNEQQVTLYTYDKRGLVTKEINAAFDETVYVYDGNGNLISKTDADGYVTEFGYDARNLVESINYDGEKNVSFLYDAAGRLIRMQDWNGTTTFAMDLLGRITSVNDHNSKTTSYTWDEVGNKKSMTYPDGSTVSYEYDLLGRMTNVTDTENQVTEYGYDAASRPISQIYPNGWTEERQYDAAGKLLRQEDSDPTNKANKQQIYSYTYDAQGNILTETRSGKSDKNKGTYSYTYDELNRLTSSYGKHGNSTANYSYDSLGNLVREKTGNNKVNDYQYNLLNQIISKKVDNKDTYSYTYDGRGNLTEVVYDKKGQTVEQYVYDATNRMVLGTNADGETSEYVYNGLGYLVGNEWVTDKNAYAYTEIPSVAAYLTVDEFLTAYPNTYAPGGASAQSTGGGQEPEGVPSHVTDGHLVIEVTDPDATEGVVVSKKPSAQKQNEVVTRQYVLDYTSALKDVILETERVDGGSATYYRYGYGLDKISVAVSPITNGSGSIRQGNQIKLWYHMDRQGSVEFMTDNVQGKIQVHVDYDAWGAPIKEKVVNNTGIRKLSNLAIEYTGHAWDEVLDIYFAQARMYDSGDRRFMTVDVLRGSAAQPITMVRYVYCTDNPLVYIDPWGLVKINKQGKPSIEIPSAIAGAAIDGSDNTYISYDDFIKIFNELTGYNSGWTPKYYNEGVYGPWPNEGLFKGFVTFNHNSGLYAPYTIDAWRVNGKYFVKLSCLTTLLSKAGVTSSLMDTGIFFRPSDWTKNKGEANMRALANNVLENKSAESLNIWDYPQGKVVFKYNKYTTVLRSDAKNKLTEITSPGFVTTVGKLFEIGSYLGNDPEDVITDAMTEAAGDGFNEWMLMGGQAAGLSQSDVIVGFIIYALTKLGEKLDKDKIEKGTVVVKDMIARYVYAEATDYRYMMKTSNAGKHFNKVLEEEYKAKLSELGMFEAFVPAYTTGMQELYDTIYNINSDWSGSKNFLKDITIRSLDSAGWKKLTSEYDSMTKTNK